MAKKWIKGETEGQLRYFITVVLPAVRSKYKQEGRTRSLSEGEESRAWQEGWPSDALVSWHGIKTQGQNIPHNFCLNLNLYPPTTTKYVCSL